MWPTPTQPLGDRSPKGGMTVTGQTPDGKKRSVDLQHTVKTVEQQEMWPSPRATDGSKGGPNMRGSKGDLMLPSAAVQEEARTEKETLWPTPNSQGGTGYMSGSNRDTWRPTLDGMAQIAEAGGQTRITADEFRGKGRKAALNAAQEQAQQNAPLEETRTEKEALWPTPAASNPQDGEGLDTWLARREKLKAEKKNGNGCGTPLVMEVLMEEEKQTHLWPSPSAVDGTGGKIRKDMSPTGRMPDGSKATVSLNQAVTEFWPTPTQADGVRGSQQLMRQETNPTLWGMTLQSEGRVPSLDGKTKGSLNPAFVETLMQFPVNWTAVPSTDQPTRPRRRSGRQDQGNGSSLESPRASQQECPTESPA